jgi:hypothetical protein
MKQYKNAKKVLPPELLWRITEHVQGCFLWIPSRSYEERIQRAERMVRLYEDGMPTDQIAERFYLTPRRVRQILQEHRKQAANEAGQ